MGKSLVRKGENIELNASIPEHLDEEFKHLPDAFSIPNLEHRRSSN